MKKVSIFVITLLLCLTFVSSASAFPPTDGNGAYFVTITVSGYSPWGSFLVEPYIKDFQMVDYHRDGWALVYVENPIQELYEDKNIVFLGNNADINSAYSKKHWHEVSKKFLKVAKRSIEFQDDYTPPKNAYKKKNFLEYDPNRTLGEFLSWLDSQANLI